MKPDLTLSEAFELYRKDVIDYKNQSAKTEEMNNCAMKSIINFLGDISITDLAMPESRQGINWCKTSRLYEYQCHS